jgi:hypothetical protein
VLPPLLRRFLHREHRLLVISVIAVRTWTVIPVTSVERTVTLVPVH